MNKVMLIGRLTRDPDIRISANESGTAVARYTLAVDRKYKKDGEKAADFISCVVFGKGTDFVQKYLRKGMKIAVSGRLHTGSYKNKDGNTIYTVDVIVDEHEFAGGRPAGGDIDGKGGTDTEQSDADGFMKVPDDLELPFI